MNDFLSPPVNVLATDTMLRQQALDHATALWVDGEDYNAVLIRAHAFYAFLSAPPRRGPTRSATAVN